MNVQMNTVLAKIRHELEETRVKSGLKERNQPIAGGVLGARNDTPVESAIDDYLEDIVLGLMVAYDVTEDNATTFVLETLNTAQNEETLPELPTADEDMAQWLAYAKTVGFEHLVHAAAEVSGD